MNDGSGKVRPRDEEEARYLSHFHGLNVVPRKQPKESDKKDTETEDDNTEANRIMRELRRIEKVAKIAAAAVFIESLILTAIVLLIK